MKTLAMHDLNPNSLTLCFITLLSYFFSEITLKDFALVMTIVAASTTAAYNIYRFMKEHRSQKQ